MIDIELSKARELSFHLNSILKTEKSNLSKVGYVNFNQNKEKLLSPQRIVVYGRKGAGKTILLHQAEIETDNSEILSIYLDCKDYRNLSYPDLLIKILISVYSGLEESRKPFLETLFRTSYFKKEVDELRKKLSDPDIVTKELSIEDVLSEESSGEIKAEPIGSLGVGIGGKESKTKKESQKYKVTVSKIYFLEQELEKYKEKLIKFIDKTKYTSVYILLDEYYYVNIIDQPLIVDYLYRLFFHSPFWIKLATNRYRSQLEERKSDGSSYGITEGEEYIPIDLDFTLERFSSAERFLMEILGTSANKREITNIEEWFVPTAFKRLVWASGGVPRDFINCIC